MIKFEADRDKCVHCGMCIKECLSGCLEFNSENIPQLTDKSRCISCQHCFAVCPTGAVIFDGKKAENAEGVNYDNILSLIKSRRSIRQYKQESLSEEKLTKLKEMLSYIPTGCNSHALQFSIVETKDAMDKIRSITTEKLLKSLSYKALAPIFNKFSKHKDALKNGDDVIYRGAPHIIVVSSPITAPCASVDPIIALSYIELYAQHLGIGTCWCGYAQMCIKLFPEISEMLKIPEGYTPVYAMLLGEPDVKYQRTILPEPYKITSITDVDDIEINFLEKAKRVVTNFIR